MDQFAIDDRLSSGNFFICDLSLSSVLFSGNALFPWVILVPRMVGLREIIDLPQQDRIVLMQEISLMSEVMQKVFKSEKLNVAALGNIVSQLHIHIVCRYEGDAAWPDPVFGKGKAAYPSGVTESLIEKILAAIKS